MTNPQFAGHPFGTTVTAETLRNTFAPLTQWEDKYRQLIMLGKQLPALPDELKAQAKELSLIHIFADCCRQINSELTDCHIRGIAVTTFGVDGALVDKQGNLLYPIISWKCPRTAAVMDNIERLISAQQLQAMSGVGAFSFNTLYKLVWLLSLIHI